MAEGMKIEGGNLNSGKNIIENGNTKICRRQGQRELRIPSRTKTHMKAKLQLFRDLPPLAGSLYFGNATVCDPAQFFLCPGEPSSFCDQLLRGHIHQSLDPLDLKREVAGGGRRMASNAAVDG